MKYKLLKDLPGLKKGTILSEGKSIFGARTLITKNDVGPIFIGNDLTEELFEEIKEPVDSIHWKPKIGERCFILENANIRPTNYTGMLRDYNAWSTGRVFRTEEECEKALDRELAPSDIKVNLALSLIVEILKISDGGRAEITLDDGKYEIVLNKLD